MTLLEKLNQTDIFAHDNGIQLTEVREGYAKAEMTVGPRHINGADVCQGGAIFTLADLAFAAVCNSHGVLTLGISNNIEFLVSARLGDHLVAEARETINHHKMPQCLIRVTNQDGTLIALATGRGYRKHITFDVDNLM